MSPPAGSSRKGLLSQGDYLAPPHTPTGQPPKDVLNIIWRKNDVFLDIGSYSIGSAVMVIWPVLLLNHRTGMVTHFDYDNMGEYKRSSTIGEFTNPFYEFDAYISSGPDRQGLIWHQLHLVHRYHDPAIDLSPSCPRTPTWRRISPPGISAELHGHQPPPAGYPAVRAAPRPVTR